jgi:hypothetical protein
MMENSPGSVACCMNRSRFSTISVCHVPTKVSVVLGVYADIGTRRHTKPLDGDNLRHGPNRDLGFTIGNRVEISAAVVRLQH